MKRVTITFDYEGTWGMPFEVKYDLVATTERLLEVLRNHQASAVFFVTGKLVDQYPELISRMSAAGHEIGIHGYQHEHIDQLTPAGLAMFEQHLTITANKLESLVGYRPRGFRAPYLMGPKFYDPMVYTMLRRLGFSWASNREIRQPDELFRPGRIRGATLLRLPGARQFTLVALNLRLIARERMGRLPVWSSLRWLLGAQEPFDRAEGIREYPLYSPLDCDLVGFPLPTEPSGAALTAYAKRVLHRTFDSSAAYFNVNVHDWITGSMDRTEILDDILAYMAERGDVAFYRPGLDEVVK